MRGEDTFGASSYEPLEFALLGASLPGRPFAGLVSAGEAVRIANDTTFGLAASVWSRDEAEQAYLKALALALRQHRGVLFLALGVAGSTTYLACGGGSDREFGGNAGGTAGNGNGVIDGGETVDLHITVRNNGTSTTAGVVDAVLRTADLGVILLDSTATAGGALGASQSALLTGGFRVVFQDTLPDDYAVPFKLAIKDNGAILWYDTFKKEVHEPALGRVRLRIDESHLIGRNPGWTWQALSA